MKKKIICAAVILLVIGGGGGGLFAQQLSSMAPFVLELKFDNGFRAYLESDNLFNGDQIKAGDYTVTMKFTLNRDLTDRLEFFMLDRTARARGGSYWHEMSNKHLIRDLKAGVEHSLTLDFKVANGSSGTSKEANCFFVHTGGRRTDVAPVISFSEFVVVRN